LHFIWFDIYQCWSVSIYKNGVAIREGVIVNIEENLLPSSEKNGMLFFSGDEITRQSIGETCFLYHESEI
jgi:hypothetical protein